MNHRKSTLMLLVMLIFTSTNDRVKASSAHPKSLFPTRVSSNPVPLFVLIHFSPWRNVYGSDSPDFVLYEDGTVIYYKLEDPENQYTGHYLSAKLSTAELSQIIERINPQAFCSLVENYGPPPEITTSDLPRRLLLLRNPDGSYKRVSIYGFLSGDKKEYVAQNVPQALMETIEFVNTYDSPKAQEWSPEYFEVTIEPDDEDSKKTLQWHEGWPDLNDPYSIKHKKFGRYSLFIHKSHNKELAQLSYKQWKSRAAILINNQRWKMEVRTPFPSEMIWLEDFRQ